MIFLKPELDFLDFVMSNWINSSPLFCRIRLVVVATQKFVAEVAGDALQYVSEF